MTYICSNCGSPKTTVRKARPSLDDRYALGYCGACSGSGEHRIERNLCREDVWNPAVLVQRKQAKADRPLVRAAVCPRPSRKVGGELVEPRKLTDAELKKAHEILERQEEMWR